jgi:hypothetical protein
VAACGEEFAEMRRGVGDGVRRGDADDVETLAFAVRDEVRLRLAGVLDQKSRSA